MYNIAPKYPRSFLKYNIVHVVFGYVKNKVGKLLFLKALTYKNIMTKCGIIPVYYTVCVIDYSGQRVCTYTYDILIIDPLLYH